MGIEKQLHGFRRSSSVSGAWKSAASFSLVGLMPPKRTPLRESAVATIGVSRAIGLPARAITTSSPAWAFSNRAESWLFAWYMLTNMTILRYQVSQSITNLTNFFSSSEHRLVPGHTAGSAPRRSSAHGDQEAANTEDQRNQQRFEALRRPQP